MRRKINPQPELDLYRSNLNLTNQYYEKYEAVSRILDQNPNSTAQSYYPNTSGFDRGRCRVVTILSTLSACG